MPKTRRTAFTLVELLVVISIIAVLVGLLLPAVNAARESARKIDCANNLKNIALATLNFESSKKRFPGYLDSVPAGTSRRPASWTIAILPELEQQPLYDLWTHPDPNFIPEAPYLDVMVCPSLGSVDTSSPANSYVCNAGFFRGNTPNGNFPTGNMFSYPGGADDNSVPINWSDSLKSANGIFLDRYRFPNLSVRTSDLRDGNGNTLLYSENLQAASYTDPVQYATGAGSEHLFARLGTSMVWLYTLDGPAPPNFGVGRFGVPDFFIGSDPTALVAKINGFDQRRTPMDATMLHPNLSRPSSNHSGTVNAAFADGRVVSLSEGLQYHVYTALMTPNGTRSDSPAPGYLLKSADFEQ